MNSGGGGIHALPRQGWNLTVTAKKWSQKTKVRHYEKEWKEEGTEKVK
jgi:hypothetical protein